MNLSKPFASLTPTLLARKGAARPAMRPQLQPIRPFHDSPAREIDDLGWNDMGEDHDARDDAPQPHGETAGAEVVALNPGEPQASAPAEVPEVVRQQDSIAERISAPAQSRRSALSDGRRAAFTLRLDAERHLKLRLASTVSNRSAQQIVTEALDRLIADRPELEELAAKIRQRG
jgi:hypothetical protein